MSLFGTLNTAVSGMSAQANMLGTIGDNIANSGTTGYKQATIDFETQLGTQSASSYTAGGVQSAVRYGIGDQGTLTSTTSSTDLAVQGNGFFVVQDANGSTALTRAGSFVPNAAGNLVNTAGYELMGYNLTDGSSATANGVGGLQVINLSKQSLSASPSTTGTLDFNLSSNATAVTGDTPMTNASDTTYTSKTSVAAYDDLGNQVTLDVYLTKTGDNTWEATTYNKADAVAGNTFQYTSDGTATGTPDVPLSSQQLVYDSTTGKLTSVAPIDPTTGTVGTPSTSPLALSVPIPNGKTLAIDVGQSTQLAADFNVATATIGGSAPSKLDHITIGADGTVTSVYANGVEAPSYRIPLANVPSPANMTSLPGNVYEPSLTSGDMTVGAASSGSLGSIKSDSLENSTVDLATQLTAMITAQQSYEANSKVITTASSLLSAVNQLING